MDLTTRCPQCGTVFTATLEHLQLRKGYIRCISCAHIFDGYDAVVPGGEPTAGKQPAAPSRAAPTIPAPSRAAPFRAAPTPPRPPAGAPSVTPHATAPIVSAADATTSMPSVLRQRQGKKEPVFETRSPPASEPLWTEPLGKEPLGKEPLRKPTPDPARPAFSISTPRQISQESSRQDPVFRVGDMDPEDSHPAVVRGRRPEPVLGPERDQRERDSIAPSGPPVVRPRQNVVHGTGMGTAGTDMETATGIRQAAPKIYVEPRDPAATGDPRHAHDFAGPELPRYRGVVSVFWSVLIVAGLVLLLAQLAYVYRAQLAQHIPALRPLLTQACAQLVCEVPYSREINQISIMSSSLRAAPGAAAPGSKVSSGKASANAAAGGATPGAGDAADSMTLQLTLRNTYSKPQEWPTLVLDLTDFSGTLVVRKNLPPASYLAPDALRQPFAANSEITVGVPIVLNGLKVNGYQLGKFFP